MVYSMTGFGKAIGSFNNKNIVVIIKTLNSKQQDISLKIPSLYKEIELDIRNILSDNLIRGKIDCCITIEEINNNYHNLPEIDYFVLDHYITEIVKLSNRNKDFSLPSWTDLMKMPGVMLSKQDKLDSKELSIEEVNIVKCTLNEALHELNNFRHQEGVMLYNVLKLNISNISKLLKKIELSEVERINLIRERITESMEKVVLDFDKNRFEQELIYYIEKIDINEEKNRLKNHLTYFLETLNSSKIGQGKTLGFITQEIGREINTMGSKSYNADMQKRVVQMKDFLEQIKEQVLNVL